jgi:hypothetical protein
MPENTKQVWKATIPVDDQWHEIETGPIVHVACQHGGSRVDTVEIWFENEPLAPRNYMVVGTGHPVPEFATHVGTGIAANGSLVWHVYEELRFG